ncbi:MAG: trigger factor [Proteobacteria bacterium]|nr:trigger factor [Pseudomonadota bacterium]
MNVEITDLSPVKKKVVVKFNKEEVAPEIKKELINIGKTAKIKGFRQGKAPFHLIEKIYTPEAQSKYSERIIRDSLFKIVEEKNIELAVRPIIEREEFQEDGFVYEAVVETHPDVQLKNYKGLEFKKDKITASEEEILTKIEEIRNKHISFEDLPEDETAKDDTVVNFDILKYVMEGKDLGTAVNQQIDLSKDTILTEIKSAILGLKKEEEKEFSFVYPEDIEDENLRGKSVDLKIKVTGLKKKVYPNDEDLAVKLGKENFSSLKEEVSEKILEDKKKADEEKFKKLVYSKIFEENPFEIPEGLKKEVALDMLQNFIKNLEQAGLDIKNMNLEWDKIYENYITQAEDFLKRQYIIKALKKQENIDITDEELNKIAEEKAEKSYNKEKMLQYFQTPEGRKSLYLSELENKIYNYILENNKIVEE